MPLSFFGYDHQDTQIALEPSIIELTSEELCAAQDADAFRDLCKQHFGPDCFALDRLDNCRYMSTDTGVVIDRWQSLAYICFALKLKHRPKRVIFDWQYASAVYSVSGIILVPSNKLLAINHYYDTSNCLFVGHGNPKQFGNNVFKFDVYIDNASKHQRTVSSDVPHRETAVWDISTYSEAGKEQLFTPEDDLVLGFWSGGGSDNAYSSSHQGWVIEGLKIEYF